MRCQHMMPNWIRRILKYASEHVVPGNQMPAKLSDRASVLRQRQWLSNPESSGLSFKYSKRNTWISVRLCVVRLYKNGPFMLLKHRDINSASPAPVNLHD